MNNELWEKARAFGRMEEKLEMLRKTKELPDYRRNEVINLIILDDTLDNLLDCCVPEEPEV